MEIPYGYCHCGCGQKAPIAKVTDKSKTYCVKGEPRRFCIGHGNARKRSANAHWKGGKVDHNGGYSCVRAPWHQKANHGYVLEHVVIAESFLGRYLSEDEVVHHKDRNRKNNSLSNLLVCTKASHLVLHAREKALATCGNADWRKCHICKQYDDVSNMTKKNRGHYHAECRRQYRSGVRFSAN